MKKKIKVGKKRLLGIVDEFLVDEQGTREERADRKQAVNSFFGFKYNYDTETDDEKKYITRQNRGFMKMIRSQREAIVIGLWHKAYIKALSCGVFVNQFYSLQLKCVYFGRHMLSDSKINRK